MEFGSTIPLFFLSLCCCATFPVISGTTIFLMARNKSGRPLAMAILLSGITFGALAMIYGLLINSWQFEYDIEEGKSIFLGVLRVISISFYLGFGIGSITAATIGIPGSYVVSRISSWRKPTKDEEMGESRNEELGKHGNR